jgi:hypothetical protein
MNGSEMMTDVRYILDEPTAASWTDAELLTYINQAQPLVASMIRGYNEDFFVTSTTLATVANTATIALPTDFIAAKRVEWINGDTTLKNPEPLYPIPWQDRGTDWPLYLVNSNSGGRPYYYSFQGTNLLLYPVPNSSTTNALRLWYEYRLADLTTATTSVSEVPIQYHNIITHFAALQAMRKMEQNTDAVGKFTDYLVTVMKSDLRRQKQEPLFIRDTFSD